VQRALVTDRWKLIRYPNVDVTQLFDLENDPQELHDLAQSPEHRRTVEELLARLKQSQGELGDELPLHVDSPKPSAWAPPRG
jgi:arylsulfatase A-like enzyme